MNNIGHLLSMALAVVVAGVWPQAQTAPPASPARTTAFVNASVLPMHDDTVLANWTVIVRDGRIVATGPSASMPAPAGSTVIDGRGKFLMPGLTEMHGHIPPPDSASDFIESVLFLYVANGVTTVRGMQGAEGQLALRDRARSGEIVAPTLYLAGPAFNGMAVQNPEQAVARVRLQHQEGWNSIKVLGGLSLESYQAMAATARELKFPFGGHVPVMVGPERAMAERQDTIDHLDQFAESLGGQATPVTDGVIRTFAERVRNSGTWVVPTLYVWETLRGAITLESRTSLPELRYLPRTTVDQWTSQLAMRLQNPMFNTAGARAYIENRTRIMRALDAAGARILTGSDAPQQFNVPGFSLHREMAEMVEAGMTPYEVLRASTDAVGEHYVRTDAFGRVAIGHRADLILLDANPFTDIANAMRRSGVMLRGRWIPESEIQSRLAAIARANGA